MLVEKLNILKKPYLPPRIEFEELEDLMDGDNVAEGSVAPYVPGDSQGGEEREDALDLGFTLDMDFVINDEPQL